MQHTWSEHDQKHVQYKKNNKPYILVTKFDFAMTNENTYNCTDILGQWPWPDLVTIFSQLFLVSRNCEIVYWPYVCSHIIWSENVGWQIGDAAVMRHRDCLAKVESLQYTVYQQ